MSIAAGADLPKPELTKPEEKTNEQKSIPEKVPPFRVTPGFSPEAEVLHKVEQLARAVVFLRNQTQAYEMKGGEKFEVWYKKVGGKEEYEPKLNTSYGTGFIIRYQGADYLVTAKHVAAFLLDGEAVMNLPAGKTISLNFGSMERNNKSPGVKWFFHSSADIAIHPLLFPQKVDHDAILSNDIPKNDEEIPLLSTVYVLGFPKGLGVRERLSPIAKKAQVASAITSLETLNIRRDLKFILLDQALAQGYSGAPVFYIEDVMSSNTHPSIKVGERIHLAGIVTLQISDEHGGKISAVVPISYLREILDSADFVQYQKNIP